MHFTVATVLALLPAMGLALSIDPRNAGRSPGSNMCDVSTFDDGTTFGIPQAPVADCKALVKKVVTSSRVSVSSRWARPWTYGDCAFSIRVIAGGSVGYVGGADVVDLLNDSSSKFGSGGSVSSKGHYGQKLSAEGEVDCNASNGGEVRVEWIVASSAYNPKNSVQHAPWTRRE